MATAKTDGFRWLPSYYETIRDLPDEDRLKLYDAILDFGFGNDVDDLPPTLQGFFRLIVPTLEKSIKFEAKQKANGSKGGRPTKPKENPNETQIKPNKTQEKAKETQTDFGENLDIDVDVDIDVDNDVDIDVEGKADKPPRAPRFTPPSVDEVRSYCLERRNGVDAQRFVDFYEANGWTQGRGKPIKNWRAAVRTWERNSQQERRPTYHQQPDLSWRDSQSITPDDLVESPRGSGQYRPRWEVHEDD